MTTKIVLVDDHQIVRDGLKALLHNKTGYEVVGEAGSGLDVEKLVRSTEPDVVVMDVAMPGLNGIEVTRKLSRRHPDVLVVALTMHDDRRYIAGMLHAGARGYLLKESAADELISAIESVRKGGIYLSGELHRKYADNIPGLLEEAEHGPSQVLTNREREVIQLLAEGKKTSQIAELLHVSVKTIETHRTNIMKKLDVRSVADLTRYAIVEGLIALHG